VKISRFENEEDWRQARLGKVTGTRLKDLVVKRGTARKLGFYELIAERLAIPDDYENPMERGKELEKEAIRRFEQETGKVIEDGLVIWTRDDNDSIAISPDGYTADLKEAVEIKCLGSAYMIKAIIEDKIPSEYWEQILQYMVVNDKLETLHFVMYDPRLPKDYKHFEVKRVDVQEQVTEYLELEKSTLEEVNEWVNKLSDF
jgi:putative phage-type endonuclease